MTTADDALVSRLQEIIDFFASWRDKCGAIIVARNMRCHTFFLCRYLYKQYAHCYLAWRQL